MTMLKALLMGAITGQGQGPTPSGTISIDQNGTYNVAAFAEAEVNVPSSGGEVIKAEGDFTLLSDGASPILEHNLGTKKVAVLIYPKSKITASNGYHNYYAEFVNVAEIIGESTWTLDASSYNSNFSGESTITIPDKRLRQGAVHQSPWPTQNDWFIAGNPPTIDYTAGNVVLTENSVRIGGTSTSKNWAAGTYHWVVWKLG